MPSMAIARDPPDTAFSSNVKKNSMNSQLGSVGTADDGPATEEEKLGPAQVDASSLRPYNAGDIPVYIAQDWIISEKWTSYTSEGLRVEANNLHEMSSKHASEARIEWSVLPGASFLCFPRLPKELRYKIWKFALPEARLVHIYNDGFRTHISDGNNWQELVSRSCSVDADDREFQFLSEDFRLVCRESERAFHLSYRQFPILGPAIETLWDEDAPPGYFQIGNMTDVVHQGYVDEERDTVFLDESCKILVECNAWLDLSCVRYLAVGYTPQETPEEGVSNARGQSWGTLEVLDLARSCPKLKTLHFVLGELWPQKIPWYGTGDIPPPVSRAYLMEIDGKLNSLDLHDNKGQLTARAQRQRLAPFQRCAEDLRRDIRETRATSFRASKQQWPEIKVSMMSSITGDAYKLESRVEYLKLIPKKPLYSNVCFFTNKPIHAFSQVHFMDIRALRSNALCLHDGTIIEQCDSDEYYLGLEAMFEGTYKQDPDPDGWYRDNDECQGFWE